MTIFRTFQTLTLMTFTLLGFSQNAQADPEDKLREFIQNVDVIYICSGDLNVTPQMVAHLYHQYYDNEDVLILGDTQDFEIESDKTYSILSFDVKPVKPKTLKCLQKFDGLLPADWKQSVIEDSDIIGTIPEYYKIIPFGEHMSPVQNSISYFYSKDKKVILSSTIYIRKSLLYSCSVLADSLKIKDDNIDDSQCKYDDSSP